MPSTAEVEATSDELSDALLDISEVADRVRDEFAVKDDDGELEAALRELVGSVPDEGSVAMPDFPPVPTATPSRASEPAAPVLLE